MMVADWYETTDRNEFLNGLGVVEGYARVHFANRLHRNWRRRSRTRF